MKFHLSFGVWFSVLAMMGMLSTVTGLSFSLADARQCIGQYLKNKGKLQNDATSYQPSVACDVFIPSTINDFRRMVDQNGRSGTTTSEWTCIKTECEKYELADLFIKRSFIAQIGDFAENERNTLLEDVRNEIDEHMTLLATECGVDGTALKAGFTRALGS